MTPPELLVVGLALMLIGALFELARAKLRAAARMDAPVHRLNPQQFATLEITKAALRSHGLSALKPEHIAQAKQAAALIVEDTP